MNLIRKHIIYLYCNYRYKYKYKKKINKKNINATIYEKYFHLRLYALTRINKDLFFHNFENNKKN